MSPIRSRPSGASTSSPPECKSLKRRTASRSASFANSGWKKRPKSRSALELTAAEVFKDIEARGRDRHFQGSRHSRIDETPRLLRVCRPATASRSITARPARSAPTPATAAAADRKRATRRRVATATASVTARNLDVVKIDADNHLILVRGAVPGPNGGLVMIRPTNKKN